MKDEALGLIEVIGLLAAIEAADTGLKSANVSLVGIENATGAYFTVKFTGDVGAVKAAVTSARVNAEKVGTVVSAHVIPRLSAGLKGWLVTEESGKAKEATQVEFSGNTAEEKEKIAEVEEISVEAEAEENLNKIEIIADSESENEKSPAYTCNLCKDPKCPREKGQMEKLCIHARGKRGNET
ncbi:BMC domain-containing protein [Lacrimispora xylanisolvens]|uniref:BMC domain-containing protein n=1 Tax=Lacrimispora xylanisolvens TaxID=384636 RepID=UPI002402BBAE|nr:BMC domain-containing protein [Paenibacillaceae bacterium]